MCPRCCRNVTTRMKAAERARAVAQAYEQNVPKVLYPAVAMREVVLGQLEAALALPAGSRIIPDYVYTGPIPAADTKGGVLISNIKVLLYLGTWQGLTLFFSLLLEECVCWLPSEFTPSTLSFHCRAALPATRLLGATGGKDDFCSPMDGGKNSITQYLWGKTVLGKLNADIHKGPMSCISESNAHPTFSIGSEVSTTGWFFREIAFRESVKSGQLKRSITFSHSVVALKQKGAFQVSREPAATASSTAAATRKSVLNTAFMKAIGDLKAHKESLDADTPFRIFADPGAEFHYNVTSSSTAASLKSSFDNTQQGMPLFLLPGHPRYERAFTFTLCVFKPLSACAVNVRIPRSAYYPAPQA